MEVVYASKTFNASCACSGFRTCSFDLSVLGYLSKHHLVSFRHVELLPAPLNEDYHVLKKKRKLLELS